MCQCGKPLEGGCSSVPGCKQNVPHKHAALIKAWADGAKIQVRDKDGCYTQYKDTETPKWCAWCDYRVKPEPKPDVVKYGAITINGNGGEPYLWATASYRDSRAKIKMIFDGESGVLKSVEVI